MNNLAHKLHNRTQRKNRIRSVVSGTTARPRLSVFVSNIHVTAQVIDDTTGKTLAYVSTVGQKAATGTLTDKAAWVGSEIAKKAQAAKVTTVVFDRGGKAYHGRVKALADAARKEGMEF
ncbi:MAG TPA: 50S ribosomal protein L18 [Candidatus Saccharimonadales bacterium]|nr:50S ribosomal protein L18 [Candidatus Saccharimonadales bacterium]